jgi:hypothetical protein
LVLIGQFPNLLRFSQAKSAVPRGRRDVIVGDVKLSLPAERFQGGEEPPRQVWHGWDSFRIFYDFFQAKSAVPRSRRDVIVGDVTSRLPAKRFWSSEEPPSLAWMGQFPNFLRFFQAKIRRPARPP